MDEDQKAEDTGTDAWEHRSDKMKCGTCMHYMKFRCRRHAPSMGGFPAVYPQLDWCGDHKLDKETMRTM